MPEVFDIYSMNKDDKTYEEILTSISDQQAIYDLAFREGQKQFKDKVLAELHKKLNIADKNIIRGGEIILLYGAGIFDAIETVKEL